jgi:hypothetical protein
MRLRWSMPASRLVQLDRRTLASARQTSPRCPIRSPARPSPARSGNAMAAGAAGAIPADGSTFDRDGRWRRLPGRRARHRDICHAGVRRSLPGPPIKGLRALRRAAAIRATATLPAVATSDAERSRTGRRVSAAGRPTVAWPHRYHLSGAGRAQQQRAIVPGATLVDRGGTDGCRRWASPAALQATAFAQQYRARRVVEDGTVPVGAHRS